MNAAYVFRVEFRLDPDGARASPSRFETTMELPAPEPGTDGWRFFRDRLWRGELGDPDRFRDVAADRLGVEVTRVAFSELRTDEAYLEALKAAVVEDLGAFNADNVDEALHKYLGSSVRVVRND